AGWLGTADRGGAARVAGGLGGKGGGGVGGAGVRRGSPADTAGLKAGDIVVELGGSAIKEVPDLQRRVAAVKPGQTMKLSVIRERKPMSFSVKIGEMPSDEPVLAEGPSTDEWGLSVESLTGDAALRLELPGNRGLLVTDVQPGSPAGEAGPRPGELSRGRRRPAAGRRRQPRQGAWRAEARRIAPDLRTPHRRQRQRRQSVSRDGTLPQAVTAATTGPRGTVLVVDDEESVRASVRAILEET